MKMKMKMRRRKEKESRKCGASRGLKGSSRQCEEQ
jgi:hypothetical protein